MSASLSWWRLARERLAPALARGLLRRYALVLVGFLLLTVGAARLVTELGIKSDFVDLLPQHFQSVRDLRRISKNVGGLGHLSIALESSDLEASEKLADAIASMLHQDFASRIRFVDYKIDAAEKFFHDNAPLYLDLQDLETIRDRLRSRLVREKREKLPLFTNLLDDDDEEATDTPDELDFSDIEAKYKDRSERDASHRDGYYTGEDGHLLVLLVKPAGGSTNIPAMRRLIGDLERGIAALKPASYAPDMQVAFAGSYKIGLEEFETLKRDIAGTALLWVSLVALVLLLFFRRLRAVWLLAVNSVVAVVWTFAIAYLAIGYVNTVTGFLGAIIAGTGINYGIILLARYFEERRLGAEAEAALVTAMKTTLVPTLGAAGTTAVAFGIFVFAEVRSFEQFGIIGFIGIVLTWIASYTLLPAMLLLSERLWPSLGAATKRGLLGDELDLRFLRPLWRHARLIVLGFGVLALTGGALFVRFLPNALEYDMSRLRTKSSLESGTAKLDARISKIFHRSMTPAVLLADGPEQARAICTALREKKREEGDAAGIERCRSVDSLLPDAQPEKLEVIGEIRHLLQDRGLELLSDEERERVREVEKTLPARALTLADLPPEMTRYFVDVHGKVGTFVYVDPRAGRNLWNAENLKRFTSDIRHVTLADGTVVTSSGDAVIFADLLKLLRQDSPRAALASFVAVFLLVLLTFGRLRASLLVVGSLVVASLMMVGAVAAMDVKLNFFNFMALPMTFGIGVDYALNVFQRYQQEGEGSIEKALRRTGSAVLLCSLTTIFGYVTLIIADSNALVSLGWLAILGEVMCLTTALIWLPALIVLREERRHA